jgi:O-antigen ligase
VAITAFAGDRIGRRAVAIVAVASALAAGGAFAATVKHSSTQRATSDRSRRAELTLRVFAHHPIVGVGIGAQPRASQQISPRPGPVKNFVSHTTPLTVLAELGLVGFAVYLALLAGAARLFERVRRLDPALGLSLGAVLLALVLHSLFYSAFFDDPVTWLVLGVAASFLANGSARAHVPQRAREEVREPVRTS